MLNRETLQFRAELFHLVRSFFRQQWFVEVDTPIRQPVLLPESNIEPIPAGSWFLQCSPEQCMKRLLAAGSGNIFQICPCFRAKERGNRHLEEFTMLEWYRLDGDYVTVMEDCQQLVRFVLDGFKDNIRYREEISRSCFGTMSLDLPWERLSVTDAFDRYAPMSLDQALANQQFDEIISVDIEPRLGLERPTFLYDYPSQHASLARLKTDDKNVAERVELYINGMELANGFSELTDVKEQRNRFVEELAEIEQTRKTRERMPEKFLYELEHLNKAAGIAFGLDRLLMLLISAESIDEVVSFSIKDWD